MDKQKGPNGFLVVLPGEIIEIPQDSDKSWLTLFYSLPRELAEKWKPAYELPRCPYEVLWTDKYDHIVCDDMFKLLVWDCYAWCAWQFFQVKDRKGNYRDIPGNWNQYAGYFPLWRLSYSIIPYIRMKFEQNGLGFQNLYNIPQGVEVPWLTYQQFSNLVGNVTDMVIAEQNWQPMIDAIWENRTMEDYFLYSRALKSDSSSYTLLFVSVMGSISFLLQAFRRLFCFRRPSLKCVQRCVQIVAIAHFSQQIKYPRPCFLSLDRLCLSNRSFIPLIRCVHRLHTVQIPAEDNIIKCMEFLGIKVIVAN